jgi:cytosine/adenosine deaminase-related metal-dependent hydrolase
MTETRASGLRVSGIGSGRVPEAIMDLNDAPGRRLLLADACVITMDQSLGDFARGDVLIESDTISAVGNDLTGEDIEGTIVIDASDTILIPGFVDTHRHMWQGQLRRMVPNVDVAGYLGLRNAFAVKYRPHDQYAGTLANALGALNTGVTTLLDLSHNTRSSAHADAGVDALAESGLRAVFAYAPPEAGEWDQQWPADLGRIKAERFDSADGRLSLRMAQRCFSDVDNLTPDRIAIARDLGIGMTIDPVAWEESSEIIVSLAADGLLGPDLDFVHCSDLSDEAWKAMGEVGVKVSLSPFVDEILGFDTHADRLPTVQRALDVGISPGLSVDIETTVPGEVFTQMRSLLAVQRMRAALGNPAVGRPQLTARDVLGMATIHGAATIGLEDTCGSLTPGKMADIVMIDQSGPNSFPLNNAYGAVVMGADTSSVRFVMVSGVIKKWGDTLVGVDVRQVRSQLEESRRYLLDQVGYEPDLFIDYPTLDTGPPKYRP